MVRIPFSYEILGADGERERTGAALGLLRTAGVLSPELVAPGWIWRPGYFGEGGRAECVDEEG